MKTSVRNWSNILSSFNFESFIFRTCSSHSNAMDQAIKLGANAIVGYRISMSKYNEYFYGTAVYYTRSEPRS